VKAPAGFACTVDAADLARVLGQVSRVRGTRTAVEVLRGVLLTAAGGSLMVAASDMQTSMRAPVSAQVDAEGSAVLADPAACLALVKTLKGPLTVAFEAGERRGALVVVSWTGARYSFEALEPSDFPAWPELGDVSGQIDRAAFLSVLGRVLPVVSSDESRPVLCAVMLHLESAGGVHAVATDSYRLAIDSAGLPDGEVAGLAVLLPGSALAEVVRLAKAKGAPEQVGWSAWSALAPLHVGFTVGDVEVVTRRIDGQFPNWAQLIPDSHEVEVSMVASELKAATKRVAAVAGPGASRNVPVRLSVDVKSGAVSLRFVAADGAEAEEQLPTLATVAWSRFLADGTKRPKTKREAMPPVGFHPKFLADAADFCGDVVRLRLLSPLRPALFLNGRDDAMHLLMPIRLAG
jgi:DNA polymerase-3 subunit beta